MPVSCISRPWISCPCRHVFQARGFRDRDAKYFALGYLAPVMPCISRPWISHPYLHVFRARGVGGGAQRDTEDERETQIAIGSPRANPRRSLTPKPHSDVPPPLSTHDQNGSRPTTRLALDP